MTMRVNAARAPFGLACAALVAAACNSSSGDNPSAPTMCAADVRVGQFALELKPGENGAPPYAQVSGLVRDGVDPKDVWQQVAHQGSCQVLIGPVANCMPACALGSVCRAGACVAAPVARPLGVATMTGLLVPLMMTPNDKTASYYGPIPSGTAFPPYTIGAAIGLDTAGGDYSPLSFAVSGIEPMAVPDGQSLALTTTKPNAPLVVRWTTAGSGGTGRVWLSFDLAHHAGIAAKLICDVSDTGSASVPGALLDDLAKRGTGGFPELTITRASVDTGSIPPGCVDFSVSSTIPKQLSVEGVTSCTEDADCKQPQTCLASLKCG